MLGGRLGAEMPGQRRDVIAPLATTAKEHDLAIF